MLRKLIVLLFFSSLLFSQDKYYVFFTDKGFVQGSNSEQEVEAYKIAWEMLTERSLERRKRTAGKAFVDFDDFPVNENYVAKIESTGAEIVHKLKWFNAVSAYMSSDVRNIVATFPFVKSIRKVPSVKISKAFLDRTGSVEQFSKLSIMHTFDYGFSLTQMELSDIPTLHDLGIDGTNIRIGIMDTGFDWKNQQSTKNLKIIGEYDFVFNDSLTSNEPEDNYSQHNHGTLVLSTIGGMDEGKLIGPAFNSEFVLAKTENITSETHAEEDNYAAALEWFESLGVDIATSSLGYSEFDAPEFSYTYEDMNGKTTIVTRAAEKAFQRGMVTVTSAGNEGNGNWFYITAPGDGFNTITVGAVNSDNIVASFSSRGPTADGRIKPDICAMGVSVFAADARFQDYAYYSGTSLSTPIAAGVCALTLSKFPYLSNTQLRQIILESGDNVKTPDNERGYGLLSALKAITFPHIKTEKGVEYIVKMFYDPNGFDPSEIQLNITVNGSEQNFSLTAKSDNVVVFPLTDEMINSDMTFSFMYKDLSGIWHRSPEGADYSKSANSNLIKHYTGEVIYSFVPDNYKLSNVYPNPVNGSANFEFELPQTAYVYITVYDILGRKVKEVINTKLSEGFYKRTIDLRGFASGVYLLNLRTENYFESKKFIYLK